MVGRRTIAKPNETIDEGKKRPIRFVSLSGIAGGITPKRFPAADFGNVV
jgi:hypothetical protein